MKVKWVTHYPVSGETKNHCEGDGHYLCDQCTKHRGNEYNGFGSDGPPLFVCPKDCPCHD